MSAMIETTCPICGRNWTPTMFDDCLLPACGCYGEEIGSDTPCESCGLSHAWNCSKIPGRTARVATTDTPKLVEIDPRSKITIHRGKSWRHAQPSTEDGGKQSREKEPSA